MASPFFVTDGVSYLVMRANDKTASNHTNNLLGGRKNGCPSGMASKV
jgi:hypothetical protein